MRLMLVGFAVAVLTAGCHWTPDRDNPVDPKSPYFVPPPQRNRPPRITEIDALTDCRANPVGPHLYMCSVICAINDSDLNLVPESLTVHADGLFLGALTFNPERARFYLLCTPDRFPGLNIQDLFNDVIRVRAVDDSGAWHDTTTLFNALVEPWPTIRYPVSDTLVTLHPRLSWDDWWGGREHTYGVSIWKMNQFVVWDTAGLAGTDTALVVPYTGWEDANVSPYVFYVWYLTVEDQRGNRITGVPGRFQVLFPDFAESAIPKRE